MLWRLLTWLLVVTLLAAPAGAGFGQFTVRDELELARKFELVLQSRFRPLRDTVVLDYVQGLADRLLAVMPPQPFPVRITVVEHPALNAFASAGGRVTVFTGLINHLESEDELASILAHELAHVAERHVAQGIERSQYINIGTILGMLVGALVGAGGRSGTGEALMLGSAAGASALAFKYTRENEHAADQLGFATLVEAGFEPAAMPRAFARMRRLQWLGGGGGAPSYLSTHPALEERTVALEERVARLPAERRQQKSAGGSFALVQTLVRALSLPPEGVEATLRPLEGAQPCLAALGMGIAAARRHQGREAEAALARASQCPQTAEVAARELGRLFLSLGRVPEALQHARAAATHMPQDATTQVLLAEVHMELGDGAGALQYLRVALERFPRDGELWQLAGRAHAAQGEESAAHLAFARSFACDRRWDKYVWHRDRAASLARTSAEREAVARLETEVEELRGLLRQLGAV